MHLAMIYSVRNILTPPNVSGYRSCRLPSDGTAVVRLIIPGRTGRAVAWKAILPLIIIICNAAQRKLEADLTWKSDENWSDVCGIHRKTGQDSNSPRYADTPRQLFQHRSFVSE